LRPKRRATGNDDFESCEEGRCWAGSSFFSLRFAICLNHQVALIPHLYKMSKHFTHGGRLTLRQAVRLGDDSRKGTSPLQSPVPLSGTVWGLPPPVSVMVMKALRVPVFFGAKVTAIMQLAPGFSDDEQVLVWEKSL
jgi:hypothetical protein